MKENTSNYDMIVDKLREHGGHRTNEISGWNKHQTLELWRMDNGDVRIVELGRDGSVEVYKPVCDSVSMEDLLNNLI